MALTPDLLEQVRILYRPALGSQTSGSPSCVWSKKMIRIRTVTYPSTKA